MSKSLVLMRALLCALACTSVLSGCFDTEAGSSQDEHVWKDQTRTIDKARDVGNTLKDAATKQRQGSQ